MVRSRAILLAILPLLCAVTGCSVSELPNRVALSGYVTFAGKPIKEGVIMFYPPVTQKGLGCTVSIKNGYYSVSKDEGPMPGLNEIRIVELERLPAQGSEQHEKFVQTDRIPQDYNLHTTLAVEIPNRSEVTYYFDLPAMGFASRD